MPWTMKAKLLWAFLALCIISLWSTGQAVPVAKKNKNKNSDDENHDLIPIPDHLLETYLPSGKFACKMDDYGCSI